MRFTRQIRLSTATAVVAVALVVLGFSSASAQPLPDSARSAVQPASLCAGGRVVYKASNWSTTFTQASGANSSVTGGPGITLTISRTSSFTVTGTLGATADVSASAEIVAVKQAYSVTLAASKTGTSSSSGSWTVPANYKVGRLAIGAFKYKGTVTRYVENKNCVLAAYGAAAQYNAPANEWAFQRSRVA